ncbi:unnamed protein product [Symbiodinium microadriaticum]|nr:unnamed protein product [Symbiodinium microadriaticum]
MWAALPELVREARFWNPSCHSFPLWAGILLGILACGIGCFCGVIEWLQFCEFLLAGLTWPKEPLIFEATFNGRRKRPGFYWTAGEASTSRVSAARSTDTEFLAASTAEALAGLTLGSLSSLARGIAALENWTAEARIARAFRAGLSAASVLSGAQDYQARSPVLPTRNRIYVVLRCSSTPGGFVTDSYRTFATRVPKDGVGRLERTAVCHAFASRAEARAFVQGCGTDGFLPASGRPLPVVYLTDSTANPTVRITAFLLKVRAGGVMVALPGDDLVSELLGNLNDVHPDTPLYFTAVQVACETPRRRAVGELSLNFVDVPWSWLPFLCSGAALRGSQVDLITIKSGETVVRPIFDAAQAAAELWITTALEDPDLQESGLGEYDLDGLPLEDREDGEADEEGAADAGELARLRARLHALELSANTAPPGPALVASLPGALLPKLDVVLATCFLLRGRLPSQIAQHEREPRGALTRQADDLLAEIEAGAIQDEGLAAGGSTDSVLERLFLIQTQMLARLSAGKPRSPLEAALGSGGGKDDASLSAKGSAARDAYVRLLKDNVAVAEQIRRLAAEELGEDVQAPPPNLMRTFVEKRSPVAEHRTLALVRVFAAHGWEQAREKWNADLEAWCSRLLMFTDQCATEGGRTQLGWLLTGLPDPAWSSMVRRRQGVRPFSRLCPSLWLSANVAYLREMEWISSRMSATGEANKDQPKDTPEPEDNAAPRSVASPDALGTMVGLLWVALHMPRLVLISTALLLRVPRRRLLHAMGILRFAHECNYAQKRRFGILKSLLLLILRIPWWAWCPIRGNVDDKSLLALSSVQMLMDAKVWFRHRGTASEY